MNLIPDVNELWKGIGGTFDSFTNILAEVVDNSISNLLSAEDLISKNINITIENYNTDQISVKILDSGSGISNLEAALKLGDTTIQNTSMNEHGFGIKHSLASANPENNAWSITTKTKDRFYYKVSAPYSYNLKETVIDSHVTKFPSDFPTGTIIEFICSKNLFFTLRKGTPGNALESKCLEYLCDDLSFLYSNFLAYNSIAIKISSNDFKFNQELKPLFPNYVGYYDPKHGMEFLDLGNGEVEVHYTFGEITDSTSRKYYKKNQTNSGCEIRLNGRLLAYNIFTPIWGKEVDPHYNHFLAQINIISKDSKKLPSTKTTKNGIRLGDEKLKFLYNWIQGLFPNPPQELSDAVSEKNLTRDLVKLKELALKDFTSKKIIHNFEVYKNIGCPVIVDIYIFNGNDSLLYKCKKGTADARNLYELLMCWDGAVSDNLQPTKAILVANSWSDELETLLDLLNKKTDLNGHNYNLVLSKWENEGIK